MNKHTVRLLLTISAGILLLVMNGCGCGMTDNSSIDNKIRAEELVISGSSSMEEVNNALADAYIAAHPGVKIRVQALGSSEGIQAAIEGIAQIGASSRSLTDEEKEKTTGLKEICVAVDGIAIVVNPANPLAGISTEQVKAVYSGQIRNWSEIGGTDHEITVIRREDGSGTLGAFCELVMGEKEKNTRFWPPSIVQNSTGAILNTVASDTNSIGFISMAAVDSRVKALAVDGIVSCVR